MANRKQHAVLGAAAGVGGYALYSWIKQEEMWLPELIGFVLAGTFGAFLPDVVEPATTPNHRAFFHSVSFVGLAGPPAWSSVWCVRDEQIRLAKECEARADTALNNGEKRSWQWRAIWHRFLAGLLPGLILVDDHRDFDRCPTAG